MVGMGMVTATIIMHNGINTGAVFGHVFDFSAMPATAKAPVSYTHLSEYDAFAINMVKTDNAAAYTSLLSK